MQLGALRRKSRVEAERQARVTGSCVSIAMVAMA